MYDEYDVIMAFEEISGLLELSSLHKDFVFNYQWFPQTFGTAIGKKYLTSFANIFMANLEDEFLHKAKCKPLVTFIFIDDHFSGWHTLDNTPSNNLHLKSLQKHSHFVYFYGRFQNIIPDRSPPTT